MLKSLMLVPFAALTLSACWLPDGEEAERENPGAPGTPVAGAETPTQRYQLSGFTGIELAGADNVVVTRGDSFSVTASGPQAVLDVLVLQVRDGKLEVRRQRGSSVDGEATITVTMPALSDIAIAGSGDVTADTLTGEAAEVAIAGSGNAAITNIAVTKLELAIAGAGDFSGTGTARSAEVSIAGSGDVAAPELTAETGEVSIAGSGNVRLKVTQTANIEIIGSGDVEITGGARCTTNEMGSGDVRCS
jgi:hypothetical protein